MAFQDDLNQLTERNPELFPGTGPWFCLPLGLTEELVRHPIVRPTPRPKISNEEAELEHEFTRLCTAHGGIGAAETGLVRYPPLMPDMNPRGEYTESDRDSRNRMLTYAGTLLCNSDFVREWQQLGSKHAEFITDHAYPLPLIMTFTGPGEGEAEKAFWEDYYAFCMRWCVQRMVAPRLPLPPAFSVSGAGSGPIPGGFGIHIFVPSYWDFRSTEDPRAFVQDMQNAIRRIYRTEQKNKWADKGPYAIPEVTQPRVMANAFRYSYAMFVLGERHPRLVERGMRGSVEQDVAEWIGVQRRQMEEYRRLLVQ